MPLALSDSTYDTTCHYIFPVHLLLSFMLSLLHTLQISNIHVYIDIITKKHSLHHRPHSHTSYRYTGSHIWETIIKGVSYSNFPHLACKIIILKQYYLFSTWSPVEIHHKKTSPWKINEKIIIQVSHWVKLYLHTWLIWTSSLSTHLQRVTSFNKKGILVVVVSSSTLPTHTQQLGFSLFKGTTHASSDI